MTRVSQVMTKTQIQFVRPSISVENAAQRMKEFQRGSLLVIDNGRLAGIITERDLVQRVIAEKKSPEKTQVSEIMSRPVITIGPEGLLTDAARIMTENKIRRLPVTEGTDVVGIVTVTDFAKHLNKLAGHDAMLAAMARASVVLAQS